MPLPRQAFPMIDFFVTPFIDYGFMYRAMAACMILVTGCVPIGVFLVLRRMSLVGDALSHAVLPGAAIGYLVAGLSLKAMSIGGFVAGLIIALLTGLLSKKTVLNEDATLAGFFIISIALGSVIVAAGGNSVDLMHFLFGNVLAVNTDSMLLIAGTTTFSLLVLSLIYRGLVIDSFDPSYLRVIGGSRPFYFVTFLVLVVTNLVAAFQALGTLMAIGLMILPAITAQLWFRSISNLMLGAVILAFISVYFGLLLSFHLNWPSGPAIILVSGFLYIPSLLFGKQGSVLRPKLT